MEKVDLVGAGSRAFHMFAEPLPSEWKGIVDFVGYTTTIRKMRGSNSSTWENYSNQSDSP
ncbi:hypothetical protein LOZ80_36365 [Paenibacillus sp. HWE-109]|uniref:hypothetical protein n=1 Tax=Paenibacillus sp. HWE-109 TaxID=1306526 RepID=UPI001EE034E6|nr:hypothetical protein [Paenibacillus sp. HWE-109]UKS26878.1 hypothetical protein LOZ80_36365 [Paenibacillus sp. HWE-109]